MTNNYRLPDEAAKRLAEFEEDIDPSDLRRELAICRLLLEDSIAKKNHSLTTTLLTTIGRLAKEFELSQVRRREMLNIGEAQRLASEIIGFFTEEFGDEPGFNDAVDRICVKMTQQLEAPRD